MHYHCEIIIPPTDDVEAAVKSIMEPFNEQPGDPDDEEYSPGHAFWDFYVIGGRWAGNKLMVSYDKAAIEEFHQWLQDEGVTVSGFRCGKEKIEPTDQIPKVDAKWNEMFPPLDGKPVACPMFNHSNDQYGRDGNGTIAGDICKLPEASSVECSRVIFAGSSWSGDHEWAGPVKATFMLCDSQWNGVNHMNIKWDGKLATALSDFRKHIEHYADGYRERCEPQEDWLAVTVDYHT